MPTVNQLGANRNQEQKKKKKVRVRDCGYYFGLGGIFYLIVWFWFCLFKVSVRVWELQGLQSNYSDAEVILHYLK